jgi:predicted transcriptional regulator
MWDNKKIKKAQTQNRDEEIWDLRVKGYTQVEIAKKVGIAQPNISKSLKRIANNHHKEFTEDIHQYKKHQTVILEEMASSALKQYLRSQKPLINTTQSGVYREDPKTGKKVAVGKVITTITKQEQNGDPRLLTAFFKAQEEIRKIWGFDNVTKDKDGNSKAFENLTIEEKVSMFTRMPKEHMMQLLEALISNKSDLHDSKKFPQENEE